MRHTARIAAFACASLTLGSLIAMEVPTRVSTARSSEFERLSQPKIVTYPGQDRILSGPDSYPVAYSPQWLAVTEKTERDRLAKWALPDTQPAGYDQPLPERDAAIEADGAGEVMVHRGSVHQADQDSDEFAPDAAPNS